MNNLNTRLESVKTLIDSGKLNLAKREVIKILDKFPDDTNAKLYYVQILYKEEEYDLALEICKNNLSVPKLKFMYALINRNLNNIEESLDTLINLFQTYPNEAVLINIICILIKQNKYEEAYRYFIKFELNDNINDNDLYRISILKKYIYNHINPKLKNYLKSDKSLGYYKLQILDYREKSARFYINKYKNSKCSFSKGVNLDEVFDRVKVLIKDEECNSYDIYDQYIIHIPNIGMVNGEKTDYLMVYTKINTKNIVLIKPYIYFGKNAIEYNDSNDYEDEEIKAKAYTPVSAIDKFNKKYGF